MKRKYRSKISEGIYENMLDLYIIGIVSDEEMNDWDERCVTKAFRASVKADRERRRGEEMKAMAQQKGVVQYEAVPQAEDALRSA